MRFRLALRPMTLSPWMTLNYYKFEFLDNFAAFRRFRRQQLLNEFILNRLVVNFIHLSTTAMHRSSLATASTVSDGLQSMYS